jgi:hypothetical protein
MGGLGRKDLPRAISAEIFQVMLGSSRGFCSWDTSSSTLGELLARWPFLFSHPLIKTPQGN